jgi:hypothetical protein
MKTLIFILFSTLFLQISSAYFGNFNKKNFLHREPPLYEKPSKTSENETVLEGWFNTRVNQFDPMDNRTFYMRYLMNRDHLVDGGPIFIFVGGEWTISPPYLLDGHFYDMAKNLSGLMLYTEHRYYGFTNPTPNLELENLQWLNVDQALADLANFIVYIKNEIPEVRNSGVILTGCSYSGMMVTWFMQKYPHLVQGVWAMSAPIKVKLDFKEYLEVTTDAIHDIGGSECSEKIESAFNEMEELVNSGNSEELKTLFRLCEPINTTNILDVGTLFQEVIGTWQNIVQFASRRGGEIEGNCAYLTSLENVTNVEAYAQWVVNMWELGDGCFDGRWSGFLDAFAGTEWTDWVAQANWRQWLYQTCAEYGLYSTTNSPNIIFGSKVPIEAQLQQCLDLYDNQ